MPGSRAPQTVEDFVRWGEQRLERARLVYGHGTDNPLDEAAWLVASTLKIPFDALDANRRLALSAEQQAAVRAIIDARITTRKPAAYLLKEAWFAGLRFYVDERVIVPRSHLGEFILERFEPWVVPGEVRRILDLCAGSGCIAIACAHAFPHARVDAADISPDALAVAEINVRAHRLADRVRLVQSDLFAALAGETYDLIVSNPPYVDCADMDALAPEYRHEPALALAAGESGLDAIVRILAEARTHLTATGALAAEVGNSCTALQAAFPEVPFTWLATASGDESVFLLTAAQLEEHAATFSRALPKG